MRRPEKLVDDPVRIGQIGLGGGIAPLHVNELEKNPNFRVVAGCDTRLNDPAAAKSAERIKAGGGTIYESYQQLLADPQVEAVIIAAPHFVHREIAVAAFAAGKHVLCEKPMATHPDDCRKMLEAQRKSGKVGAVQMQHVGRRSMLQLRDRLQDGAIGELREVFTTTLWWRENSYYSRVGWAGRKMHNGEWNLDGVLFNQGVHFINETLVLVAPGQLPAVADVRDVRSALYRFHDAPQLEMEDTAFVTGVLDVPGRPRLHLVATTCASIDRPTVEIIGTKGRALWNGVGHVFADGRPMEEFHDDGGDFDGSSLIFNSFAAAVRTGGPTMTDFSQIMRTTQFVVDVYDAANWNIKQAPWDGVGSLAKVISAAQRQRCLPADLQEKPGWA